jgi:DNA adenine methylase
VAESLSPLRYPGGKQILARVLAHVIRLNGREGGVYVEPYAGGAGAALSLLFGEHVKRIVINDADSRIYAFWDAVLHKTERFLRLLRDTPLTVDEWKSQRLIYQSSGRHSSLRVGFATFYLNRCNRSGIIGNGGLIGGLKQTGKWKIDARFNRQDLSRRVERIAHYRERIGLHNADAETFLKSQLRNPSWVDRAFVYLDPPYYAKGSQLYLNYYTEEDHARFAAHLDGARFNWIMSYDNVRPIRDLYSSYRLVEFNLGYSARRWRIGRELLIMPRHVRFPSAWAKRIPAEFISASTRISTPMPTAVGD